jgi:hypothetical protein
MIITIFYPAIYFSRLLKKIDAIKNIAPATSVPAGVNL